MRVPVLAKKRVKIGIWERKVRRAMSKTNRESMARSVTTVPMAWETKCHHSVLTRHIVRIHPFEALQD